MRVSFGVLALALFISVSASAQVPLFDDGFSGDPLGAWAASPLGLASNWSGAGGTAAYNGGGHTQLVAGSAAWSDYTVQTKFRLATASNYPGGLRGRVNLSTGAGYAAWVYPGDGVVKLFRASTWHIDTNSVLLAQASVGTIPASVWHTLAIDFDGAQIAVSLNGTTVITTTDATLASGGIAFDVSNQPVEFDDVAVTQGATTLFSEDFSPNPLRNWTASPLGLASNWTATSGVASYNGGGHTQLYAGDDAWTDYTVEAKFRIPNAQNYPGGIRGRVNPATGESYAAWIYPGDGVIKLFRVAAWHIDTQGLTLLDQASVGTIATDTFHTLALSFDGAQISVSYDGSPVLNAVDSTYAAGAIALDVSNQPIDFDDIRVNGAIPPPANALFSDDFNDTSLARWAASPLGLLSNWSAAATVAAYNGGGHTQLVAGDAAWTDYRFQTKFRLAAETDHPGGIRGRIQPSTGAGYAAWLYPSSGTIKLWRSTAWHIDTTRLTLLGQASVGAIPANAFHTLALSFEDDQISVAFNGVTVIAVTDATFASGKIALDVSNRAIEYDDVLVTAIQQAPDAGPGGPVLVLSSAANPFSRYYGEILLAEGLNAFAVKEINSVTGSMLTAYDVIILGEMALTSAQVTMLADWVNAGGNLIAMRPDAQLATLLGLTSGSGTLGDGYVAVDTSGAPGAGIVSETMQFHGTANLWSLNGATAVAALYSDATTPAGAPAVTVRSVGANGGSAAAFLFDLARSVALTRQGNPAWSGQERDGIAPIRSDDLFFPSWIDFARIEIPQADEQQRLLVNLIQTVNHDRKPLPRFWYLPDGRKAAVVMTGDDHANGGTAARFAQYQSLSASGCSVEDWQCVRGTSYVYSNTPLTNAQAAAFQADGFEIGLHVSTSCGDWTPATLQGFYATQLAAFASAYPGVAAPVTNRTHCIVWSDYVSQPKIELANGIRFDTNYYYWPGTWVLDRPGFFTGSGLPMRFADTDGTRIDVYQAATQMTDESSQTYSTHIDTLLDNALGTKGYYAVVTANMHTDAGTSSGSDAIVTSAQARGVAVVSAKQMLTWLDGRNGSSFGSLSWSGSTLTFTVTSAPGARGLRALVPLASRGGTLSALTRDGNAVSWSSETVKGIAYATFPAAAGSYSATYTP
ncbi:MAG TPA: family 16 glycoside hydrolase [Thermoanaerobaculia bacterium]